MKQHSRIQSSNTGGARISSSSSVSPIQQHTRSQSAQHSTSSVSAPSSSSSSPSSPLSSRAEQQQQQQRKNEPISLDNCIGVHVKIKTIFDEIIQGEIYAFDPQLQLLALYISGGQHESSKRKSFKVIKTNTIVDAQSLSYPSASQKKMQSFKSVPFSDLSVPLPPVNFQRLREREEEAIRLRKEKLGVGVTLEAQYLFDALSKMYSCHWRGEKIIVLDEIIISKPYTVNDIKGGNEKSRERISLTLAGEIRKMKQIYNK